jgi:hypothetical protein
MVPEFSNIWCPIAYRPHTEIPVYEIPGIEKYRYRYPKKYTGFELRIFGSVYMTTGYSIADAVMLLQGQ